MCLAFAEETDNLGFVDSSRGSLIPAGLTNRSVLQECNLAVEAGIVQSVYRLCDGLDDRGIGVLSPVWETDSTLHHRVQISCGSHPASNTTDTGGYFPWVKWQGLTTHVHLVSTLRTVELTSTPQCLHDLVLN